MRKRTLGLLLSCAWLLVITGCAAKTVTPVVTAPKHPDFVFPAAAPGAAPALVAGVERGWQFMQAGDFRNAERELTRALKTSPQSVNAETALGYLELARGDAGDALPIFDRALSRDPKYASALAGRGYALMDLKREGDALASFEAALKADPSLVDLQGRVDVLRFRATQDAGGPCPERQRRGPLRRCPCGLRAGDCRVARFGVPVSRPGGGGAPRGAGLGRRGSPAQGDRAGAHRCAGARLPRRDPRRTGRPDRRARRLRAGHGHRSGGRACGHPGARA